MSKGLTPLKAIRRKCYDCSCYQWKEVRLCTVIACPLWPYRHGHRPTAEDTETHLQSRAALDERNRLEKERLIEKRKKAIAG